MIAEESLLTFRHCSKQAVCKTIKTMVKRFSVWFIQSLIRLFTLGFYHKSLPRPLIEILREPFLPKTAHFLEKHAVRFIESPIFQIGQLYPKPNQVNRVAADREYRRPEHWRWIVELKQARFTNLGAVISKRGSIIKECCAPVWWGEDHATNFCAMLPRDKLLPGRTLILHSKAGSNFYHWYFDVLSRILVLREAGISVADFEQIIVNDAGNDRLSIFCKIFNIQEEQLVKISDAKKACFLVETAVVPSCYQHLNYSDAPLVDWLHKTHHGLWANNHSTVKRRVFIARDKSVGRRIVNQVEIDPILQRYSIEKVFLEDLSIICQMRLFNESEIVISPHGAGLTNLLWCRPNTQVIEFSNSCWHNPEYYYLSYHRGLDYTEFLCNADTGCPDSNPAANVIVDVESLEEVLSQHLLFDRNTTTEN